jgi:acyl transferase domain-containing protein
VAIVGIGCRFPGAPGPLAYWRLLREGKDAVRDVPASRWDKDAYYDPDPETPGKMNCRRGGFLEDVDRFDPRFFGLSPREVRGMDPQQRLLLEVAWEALEDAGQSPDELAGTPAGVFMGVSSFDYYELLTKDPARFDAYTGTGNLSAVKANRLSYFFDLKGPSLAVDTACSSSLVATHLACQSLWSGESTVALVGGVHLLLSPGMSVGYAKGGFMAPDGRCKTFDARADGYVRGEGAGVVVLRRLSAAEARGDRVYAVVLGSAVNQDGASNGITAPNPLAQQAVLEAAYRNAGVSPGAVRYVEAHGTGTKLGDPIEMKALAAVLSRDRAPGDTCAVGSVKTNIGHLEAAAGIAGLIKVALSLAHRQVPPSLHFDAPNPYIPFDAIPLRVQRTLGAWPAGPSPAIAGVSSFGFGGTNAHVVLAEAPAPKAAPRAAGERPAHLLCLSARSEEALNELARRYARHLQDQPELRVADVCHTAATGRSHFKHRLAVVGASAWGLARALEAAAAGRAGPELARGEAGARGRPRVAFVFPGHAAPEERPGRALLENEPALRGALERCDSILRGSTEAPLLDTLLRERAAAPLDGPALFALQYGLAELWSSWGVSPDAVLGQGVGAYVAACVAGACRLEDGLKLAVALSRSAAGRPGADAAERSGAALAAALRDTTCSQPRIPLVSSVTGQVADDRPPGEAYWAEPLLGLAPIERGTESLRRRGFETFLEVGLDGVSEGGVDVAGGAGWRSALPPPLPEWPPLLASLGRLYVRGVVPDWAAFEGGRDRRRVTLPTYPFQRERYWLADGSGPDRHSK